MRFPMTVITLIAFGLSIADVITTIYCLNNVPGCIETNPIYPVCYYDDVKYKNEIIKSMLLDEVKKSILVVVGLSWDIAKMKIRNKVVRYCYNLFAAIFLSIVILYVYVNIRNILAILL